MLRQLRAVHALRSGVVARRSHSNDAKGADYQEIVNTINGFLLCMDKNRGDNFADLFTVKGACEIIKARAFYTGKDSLKGLCEHLHTRFTPAMHMESNIRITMLDSHNAENESYWMAVLGGDIVSTGSHEDTLVKCNRTGLWRFQKRVIRHHWTKDGGFED